VAGAAAVAIGGGALALGGLRMAAGGSVGAVRSAASLAGTSARGAAADAAKQDAQPAASSRPGGEGAVSSGGRSSGLAAQIRRGQQVKDAARVTGQTLKEGDKGGHSSGPKLRED